MNKILWNDIEFESYVNFIIEDEQTTDEEKNMLLKAKVENELTSNEKIDKMSWWIIARESRIDTLKDKKKQLDQWIKSEENKTDYIKKSIIQYMELKDIKQIETDSYKISLRNNPPSVEITDESYVPDIYKKTTVEIVMDKQAIKEKLINGENIEGCRLITDKKHLNIK